MNFILRNGESSGIKEEAFSIVDKQIDAIFMMIFYPVSCRFPGKSYILLAALIGAGSCSRDPEMAFSERGLVQQQDTSVPLPEIILQAPAVVHNNSIIVMSGNRDSEYWVLRLGIKGTILWDSLSLNVPPDTLR
jgi:hypothetical protein